MPYQVILSRKAEKELAKLSTQAQIRIAEALLELGENPRPYGYRELKGEDAFRVRVGDYRIIYEIQDDILLVYIVRIGHRKDVYD